jgi:hypothetical protein
VIERVPPPLPRSPLRTAALAICVGAMLATSPLTAAGGSAGYAIEFDGIHGYLGRDLPEHLRGCHSITLAAMVIPEGPKGSVISPEPRGQAAVGLGFHMGISAGKVYCAKGKGFGLYDVLVSQTAVGISVWHHIAATYDGSTMRLYVDGVLDTSLVETSPIAWDDLAPIFPPDQHNYPDPAQLFMGASKHNDLQEGATVPDFDIYEGCVDEAQIWNRALTQPEIDAYRRISLTGLEPGLVDYWKFDEGTGTTTADEVTSGGDLTLYPGARWKVSTAPVNVVGVPQGGSPPGAARLAVFPNPTHGMTSILLDPSASGGARISIFDTAGRRIAQPWSGRVSAGQRLEVMWDGRDREGRRVANGVYLVRSESASAHFETRLLMVR